MIASLNVIDLTNSLPDHKQPHCTSAAQSVSYYSWGRRIGDQQCFVVHYGLVHSAVGLYGDSSVLLLLQGSDVGLWLRCGPNCRRLLPEHHPAGRPQGEVS